MSILFNRLAKIMDSWHAWDQILVPWLTKYLILVKLSNISSKTHFLYL